MLTPSEIREKEFDRGRGYTREVRLFLAKVAGEFEVLYSKNAELTDRLAQMEALLANYENIEDSMKNALLLAQKTADSTMEAANKEAENILLNAKVKSEEMLIETVNHNNRIKLANKNLMDRFELYKQQCADFLKQQQAVLEAIEINFDPEDVDVMLEKVYTHAAQEVDFTETQYPEDEYDDYEYEDEEYADGDYAEYEDDAAYDEDGAYDENGYYYEDDDLAEEEFEDEEDAAFEDVENLDENDDLVDEEYRNKE